MTIAEFFKFSWFSSLAYVEWDTINTQSRGDMIKASASINEENTPAKLEEGGRC
jgi:hypothetical protein